MNEIRSNAGDVVQLPRWATIARAIVVVVLIIGGVWLGYRALSLAVFASPELTPGLKLAVLIAWISVLLILGGNLLWRAISDPCRSFGSPLSDAALFAVVASLFALPQALNIASDVAEAAWNSIGHTLFG